MSHTHNLSERTLAEPRSQSWVGRSLVDRFMRTRIYPCHIPDRLEDLDEIRQAKGRYQSIPQSRGSKPVLLLTLVHRPGRRP